MPQRILIVRLGAMGDIVHALPAAAFLRRRLPEAHLTWLVERRWLPLLEGSPNLDEIAILERSSALATVKSAWSLRGRFDAAYDLQGLLKSSLPARFAAAKVTGFFHPRESFARYFFTHHVNPNAAHIVDQFMELAGAGLNDAREFWLPPGRPEGSLPTGDYILASPHAGWTSKQWPYFEQLRALLAARGLPLILNGAPGSGLDHESTIPGLIHATRRARAVIGVDSGPLHLAAALGKPGVAIFGPTDPARNGPYGGSIRVLRDKGGSGTYKRGITIDPSMKAISAQQVFEALSEVLGL